MTPGRGRGQGPFRWTPKRDRALRAARADGFSFRDAAAMVGSGATESDARQRMRELKANPSQGRVEVPKPVPRPPDPHRRPLIDLSSAPSSMEMAAARWRSGSLPETNDGA